MKVQFSLFRNAERPVKKVAWTGGAVFNGGAMDCNGSWVEVDLGRLRGNAAAIQSALGAAGLIAVVKADAYGHGLEPAAAALARAGVSRFAVAYVAEAEAVRRAVPGAE